MTERIVYSLNVRGWVVKRSSRRDASGREIGGGGGVRPPAIYWTAFSEGADAARAGVRMGLNPYHTYRLHRLAGNEVAMWRDYAKYCQWLHGYHSVESKKQKCRCNGGQGWCMICYGT